MKKLVIVLFSAAATGWAFAVDAVDSLVSDEIGVIKIDTQSKNTICAVPWYACADGTSNISVSNVVKTANLTSEDRLYVYHSTTGKYDAWKIENNQWVPISQAYVDAEGKIQLDPGTSASTYYLSRGDCFWIVREDATKPIYLVGKAPSGSVAYNSSYKYGSAEKSVYSLIANNYTNSVSIAEMSFSQSPTEGDMIRFPAVGSSAPKTIKYTNNKWNRTTLTFEPGMGAWYISKGTPSEAQAESGTITWKDSE